MKKHLLVVLFLFFGYVSMSQSSRFVFVSGGFSFLTDVNMTEFNWNDTVPNKDGNVGESFQTLQWNFVSGMLSTRFMLIPLTVNSSLSVSVTPTVNIGAIYSTRGVGSRYGLNASVPMFLELNIGAASRHIASKDWGLVLGAGVEYCFSPIVSYELADMDYTNKQFQRSWWLPMGKIGYRYWSKKNKVNEIILKVGFGEKQEDFYNFDKFIKQYKPIHIGLSFLKIINY